MKFVVLLLLCSSLWSTPHNAIIDHYDAEAEQYDNGYSDAVSLAENEVVMQMLKPLLGESVLDIGCGTGLLLDYLSPEVYLGIDISPAMIQKAQAKHPGREFIVADMERVLSNTAAGSYDSVVCLFGPISYSLYPEKLIAEFHRVLKPGGILILMPYTKRIENNFCICEYTTATESSIAKIYYSTEMLHDLMSRTDFKQTNIIGINYFGNLIARLDALYKEEHSMEFYKALLLNEQKLVNELPIEYARHCLLIAKKEV
jgi:SAM-dependent methyltransferase